MAGKGGRKMEKLKKAVLKQLGGGGKERCQDVVNHGAEAGFRGFTYYAETCKFYKSNKKAIIELAKDVAVACGEDLLVMISHFRCLKDMDLTPYEISLALESKGDKDAITLVQNAMAWFALEEVCYSVTEEEEEEQKAIA